MDILVNVGLKIGLFKYKFTSSNVYILLYSYRSILGFKVSILIFVVGLILIPILFMIDNYIFIILSLLSVIFVKAFIMNFYTKHFKLFDGSSKNINYTEIIKNILSNIEKIVKLLLKLWMISVVIIITLRYSIAAMILNEGDINIVSIILIVSLPLPIFLYLLNFIIKFIKKEKINASDYYLYNDFVIERVNLYRIIYLVSIHYMIRYYYHTYCIIIITVLIIAILIACALIIYKLNSQPGNNKVCKAVLESRLDVAMSTVLSFISISPLLQEACNKGFMEYYTNTGTAKYTGWKKILWSNPGIQLRGSTINFIENRKLDNLLVDNPHRGDLLRDYRAIVEKSPILNMAYRLKNNDATLNSPNKWSIRPVTLFSNERYYGSVSLVIKEKKFGRFLVVIIIRHDSEGCVFVPTYFLPDKSPDSRMKVIDTVNLLEYKYNIAIPREPNRHNGLIIFTQAESINDQGLFKVWRPSINFTEPKKKIRVQDYFLIDEENINRPQDFSTCLDTIKDLKVSALEHTRDYSKFISPQKQLTKVGARGMAHSEFKADKKFKELVQFYISKGSNDSSQYDLMSEGFYEDYPDNYKDALRIVKANVEATKLEESYRNTNFNDLLDNVISEFARFQSNNQYIDHKYYYFQTRRDYSMRHTLFPSKTKYLVYFNLYKTGILEGFKDKNQTLGDLDSDFILPLKDSRTELVKCMSTKFSDPMYEPIPKFYGVSINRLTYEFYEIIPSSDIWGVFLDEDFTDDEKDIIPNCEVYSIIDLSNNSTKSRVVLDSGNHYLTIPKHDYNLFNYQDEYSIRKFMDFIHENRDGSLTYQSDEKNLDVAGRKSINWARSIKSKNKSVNKEVGFGQDAVDYKNKERKGIHYTLEALERPEKQAKATAAYLKNKERRAERIAHIQKNGKDIDNAGELLRKDKEDLEKGKEVIDKDKGKGKSIEGESIEQDESIGQDDPIEQNQEVGQPESLELGGSSQFAEQYPSLEVGGYMVPSQFAGQYSHMGPSQNLGQYSHMGPNQNLGQYQSLGVGRFMTSSQNLGQYSHMGPSQNFVAVPTHQHLNMAPNQYTGQHPNVNSSQPTGQYSDVYPNQYSVQYQDTGANPSTGQYLDMGANPYPAPCPDMGVNPYPASYLTGSDGLVGNAGLVIDSSMSESNELVRNDPIVIEDSLFVEDSPMAESSYPTEPGESSETGEATGQIQEGESTSKKGKAIRKNTRLGTSWRSKEGLTKSEYLDMYYGNMYAREYIYLGGERALSEDDAVNESSGKQVSRDKAVAEPKGKKVANGKKVSKDKTVGKSKGKKGSRFDKGKQVSKGKGVAFNSEIEKFLIPAKESNGYQYSAEDFHASPDDGFSYTNWGPSSYTNGGPSSYNNGGPSSEYVSSKFRYEDGYRATGFISPRDNSNDNNEYLPMGENNGGYSPDSFSEDISKDDSQKYPLHKTSTKTGSLDPIHTGFSLYSPMVIHISSDDSSSEGILDDDSHNCPGYNTSSAAQACAAEARATGNNMDVSSKDTDLNITYTHRNLEGNNTDISEDNAGIYNTGTPIEDNDVSLDRAHLDLPDNDDYEMEDSSIDNTASNPQDMVPEWEDIPTYDVPECPMASWDFNSYPHELDKFGYREGLDWRRTVEDAIARMQEEGRNEKPDSHMAVDTSVDSPVVANMNVEAEESVEFNTTAEAELGVAQATPTTVAYHSDQQETGEVEESHSIPEVREIEETNSSYPYSDSYIDSNNQNQDAQAMDAQAMDQQTTVEITGTESQTTIPGDLAASEDLPEESVADMNSGEDNMNSAPAIEENQRISVNSSVYPSLHGRESEALFLHIDEEYVQPYPDSFLDFDPCGVDVDFYGYEYHENVRQQRREAEGVGSANYEAENDTDDVVDLDEIIAAEYRERFNNTPTSVRRDISEEGVVNSPAADNQDISEEDVVNSSAPDNQDISGGDAINSPTTVNQDISEDIDKDVPNSPSVLSQDISGEEDIDIVMPMPRPNSEGEIVFDCIIARSEHPEGNEMSELVASGFRESYL